MSSQSNQINIQKKFDTEEIQTPRCMESFVVAHAKIQNTIKKYIGDGLLLDIGGYDGKMSEGFNSIVLDIALNPLKYARRKGMEGIVGNMHDLPFKNSSFDGVLICHVLEQR